MNTRERLAGFTYCKCEHPYPTALTDTPLWICGVCGDLTLDPRNELGAQQVLSRLEALIDGRRTNGHGKLLTPAQVEGLTGRSHTWIREHREELGVVYPAGEGKNARMMFPPEAVEAFLEREREES